jgi:bacterial/archaeal transporter family-2 protein
LSSETLRYASIMLLAGIGIPIMAVLNTQLGKGIGSPAAAATVLFTVALLATAVVMFLTGGLAPLRLIPSQPTYFLLAGFGVVFYVLSVTWIAPRFGIGNAVFCVLLGQMIAATAIDHFGLFGALVRPLTLQRASGISFMVLGVLLIQKA